jgi:hypothetical protein
VGRGDKPDDDSAIYSKAIEIRYRVTRIAALACDQLEANGVKLDRPSDARVKSAHDGQWLGFCCTYADRGGGASPRLSALFADAVRGMERGRASGAS